jgi:hypothetical protein
LKDYDPGRPYPYQCPKKKESNTAEANKIRSEAAALVSILTGEKCYGPEADGKVSNTLAHCFAACRIHREMPQCDFWWEQSEWKWEDGKAVLPKESFSDLDIRNNNVGREDSLESCWGACVRA